MAKELTPELASIDGLDRAIAEYYEQGQDGKYRPKVKADGGYSLERTQPLRDALAVERDARKKLTAQLRLYGWTVADDGKLAEGADGAIDPEIARDAISKVKAGKLIGSKDPAEIEELRATLNKKAATDREQFDRERAEFTRQREDDVILGVAEREIRATGGNDDTVKVMLPVIRARSRAEKDSTGKWRDIALDESGRPAVTKIYGSTDPMRISELTKQLKADRAYAVNWPGKAAGGSGANHSTGGSGQGGPQNADLTKLSGRALLDLAHQQGN
jgi:hypothetical protein